MGAPSGASIERDSLKRGLRAAVKDQLREELKQILTVTDDLVQRAEDAASPEESKYWLRKAHDAQRQDRLSEAKVFIERYEENVIAYFANGNEIDPAAIDPVVSPVITEFDSNLWRYASLTWSVPVSQGYGRRTKFLVKDRQNGKLIAIFALGDPVIALGVRDNEIGWNKEQRHKRLYNVYDAFVLGAVEPYRQLLAGKLVALLAIANETRQLLAAKYAGTTTEIRGEEKNPTPVLITTSSALGRSSIYNRLTFQQRKAFVPVGYTSGFGHFHISEEMFEKLVLLTKATGNEQSGQFGKGANYRFRVIRKGLVELGLPADGLRHGVRREVFLAPLAHNWKEYLRGETDRLEPIDMSADSIADYYRHRWAIGRAERKPDFKNWSKETMKLSDQLPSANVQSSLLSSFDSARLAPRKKSGTWNVTSAAGSQRDETLSLSGESISGISGNGNSQFTDVTMEDVEVTLADTKWENGERDVQAVDRKNSPSAVDSLVRRLRIGVYRSPLQEQLAYMELRCAIPDANGRAVIKKLSEKQISTLLGVPLAQLLPSAKGIVLGTREQLFRDDSRRRTELCALFPSSDTQIPAMIWTVTRLMTFIAGLKSEGSAPGKSTAEVASKTKSVSKPALVKSNQPTKKVASKALKAKIE